MQFPKNTWYAAIWSKDLADKPVARTFLGEAVVLYRGKSGKAAALEDRCCHRAAPLSLGEVEGDNLRCGYHGLTFAADGACVAIPSQATVPSGARVRAYPVAERWNTVWIWMGDPARADDSKIVELPWLADPGWTATPGYLRIDANAQLLVDNLLDYTHVAHLHRATIAGDPREASTPTRTEVALAYTSSSGPSRSTIREPSVYDDVPTEATHTSTSYGGWRSTIGRR